MSTRVLIVDDDSMSNEILTLLCRQQGHTTRSLQRGDKLTEVVDVFEPDVVLLDVRLPGMSGLEAARRLRARGDLRDLPILGVSGLGSDEDKAAAALAGFSAYFTKPLDYPALLARILQACANPRTAAPALSAVA